MKPRIYLRSSEKTWLESTTNDKGTLNISRIVNYTKLLPETLRLGDLRAYEGIMIEDITIESRDGQSEDSNVLVVGEAKLAVHTEGVIFLPQSVSKFLYVQV